MKTTTFSAEEAMLMDSSIAAMEYHIQMTDAGENANVAIMRRLAHQDGRFKGVPGNIIELDDEGICFCFYSNQLIYCSIFQKEYAMHAYLIGSPLYMLAIIMANFLQISGCAKNAQLNGSMKGVHVATWILK